MISGERFAINPRTSIHVYPYSPDVELRVNTDLPVFAAQAVINRRYDPDAEVYEVKTLSRLYFMVPNLI